MFSRLKNLFTTRSGRKAGPSGICLWRDLTELNSLAEELAAVGAGGEGTAAAAGDSRSMHKAGAEADRNSCLG